MELIDKRCRCGNLMHNVSPRQQICEECKKRRTPPGTARQLQRLAIEGRPGACLGCGFENACASRGCAVLRTVSQIVALIERK